MQEEEEEKQQEMWEDEEDKNDDDNILLMKKHLSTLWTALAQPLLFVLIGTFDSFIISSFSCLLLTARNLLLKKDVTISESTNFIEKIRIIFIFDFRFLCLLIIFKHQFYWLRSHCFIDWFNCSFYCYLCLCCNCSIYKKERRKKKKKKKKKNNFQVEIIYFPFF